MNTLQLSPNLYRFTDTCHVYILRFGQEAVLIDFGAGGVLDALPALGIRRVTDILVTHYHRDQVQGLPQGLSQPSASRARLWVPHAERELFSNLEIFWQSQSLYNDYLLDPSRFALLESVPVSGTLRDYSTFRRGSLSIQVLPTPGHTTGSVTLMTQIDGKTVTFCGDLLAGDGKLWSLSATQWSYNGAEGVAATLASVLDLQDHPTDRLLPSHGEVIEDPAAALDLLGKRLRLLLDLRNQNPRLGRLRKDPYVVITPHLLRNLTSTSNTYVLRSESGKALMIDFGYDFMTGMALRPDPSSRRPWLYTLPSLKRQHNIQKVDVVIPTHSHDDHVAGFNLLQSVEGTQVWAPENFADVLEQPSHYNLPCLWYEPILVDRRLPMEAPIQWEEYTLHVYPLPGHTRYAAAICFEVDGQKVMAVGDQYQNHDGSKLNYVYRNDFQPGDYLDSALLYQRLQPDLILPGHWEPIQVQPGYIDSLVEQGQTLERLHQELLPAETLDMGSEGSRYSLSPYQASIIPGERLELCLSASDVCTDRAVARLVTPPGWLVEEECLPVDSANPAVFHVHAPWKLAGRRFRVAADVQSAQRNLGQQVEALVSVQDTGPVLDRDFPDPGVLVVPPPAGSLASPVYYAYATNSGGMHAQSARSLDLHHWEMLSDALPALPRWAVQAFQYTWAPEVLALPGKDYAMFFTTRLANDNGGIQSIGLAKSHRPEGPFLPDETGPFLCQMEEGGSIDPAPFVDDDGRTYLLWKNDGNSRHNRTWIYLQELNPTGPQLVGEPRRLITYDQPWEGYVVEGPSLLKQDGKYYLFYAANDFTTIHYAIGYAVADNIWGPYIKSAQPFLISCPEEDWIGPGGPEVVHSPQGEPCLLFHAWSPGRYRSLHLAHLAFHAGVPVLKRG